jgi:hypothetical protein
VLPGFATLLVMVAAAGDASSGFWLEVSALDPGCPNVAEVASAVEGELGRAMSAVPIGALPRVRCEIARDGQGWRADIAIHRAVDEANAVRRIRVPGKHCRQVLPAVVLTLTLALAAPAASDPQPVPVTQVRDPELPPALVARAPIADPPTPWNFSAAAVVTSGALPELAGGLALGGRRRFGPVMLGLEARSDRGRAGQRGTVAVSGWRSSAAVLPCVAPGAVSGCLVTRLGLLNLRGEGPRTSRAVQGVLAEAGARVGWQLALAGQPLELHAEVALPLVRTRLLADGQPVWRAPVAVFGLGIAVLTAR